MFRLLELEFKNHKILKDLKLDFVNDPDASKGPYITLLIGQNGTGKSHILKSIIDVFYEIVNLKNNEKTRKAIRGGFRIKYNYDTDVYEIIAYKDKKGLASLINKPTAKKNNQEIPISSVKIPESIIANAIMLNDRFPMFKEGEFSEYHYMGIRRTPSATSTRNYIRKIIFNILKESNNNIFLDLVKEILKFIGYNEKLEIGFYIKYREKLFNSNLTNKMFNSFFTDWEKNTDRNRDNPSWGLNEYNRIKDDVKLVGNYVSVINKISNSLSKYSDEVKSQYYFYNIFDQTISLEEVEILDSLYKLDLLSDPQIRLNIGLDLINLGESSSGEYHLLGSLIGLLSKMKDQSIVLIDEPEISLHPSWQIKYFGFLQKVIFKDYPQSHFIAASHSHFLVSDLVGESSTLVALKKKKKIEATQIAYDTYAWSAEAILYDVFELRTSRNYYFEIELRQMLSLISEGKKDRQSIGIIEMLVEKFDKLIFSSNDPLIEVINLAKGYLRNDKTN